MVRFFEFMVCFMGFVMFLRSFGVILLFVFFIWRILDGIGSVMFWFGCICICVVVWFGWIGVCDFIVFCKWCCFLILICCLFFGMVVLVLVCFGWLLIVVIICVFGIIFWYWGCVEKICWVVVVVMRICWGVKCRSCEVFFWKVVVCLLL